MIISCPSSGTALGYGKTLPAVVTDGIFHAEVGTPGKPRWLAIDGEIGADGKAFLVASALTGGAKFTVGNFPEGTPVSYTVAAQFDGAKGNGKRNEGRPCNVIFAKK